MLYTIPSYTVSPGSVYQPKGGLPSIIKTDGRAAYFTRGGSIASGRVLDQLPSNNGTRRTGEEGRCYLYDGTDDYSDIPDLADDLLNSSFSVSFWFNKADATSDNDRFFDYSIDANNTLQLTTDQTSQNYAVKMVVGGVTKVDAFYNAIDFGVWHQLTFTWDGSSDFKGYLDGVEMTAGSTTPIGYGAAGKSIGRRNDSSSTTFFEGKIFDFRIYNKALTQDEVNFVYSFGQTGTDPDLPVNWWKCDEQSGTVGYDCVGGNNLTHTNITAATFHATQDIWSFQNQVGYGNFYLGDGATGYLTVNQSTSTPLDGENWTVAYKCSKLLNTAGSTLFSAGNSGNHTYFTIFHWASSNQLQIFARWDSTNTTNDLFTLPNGSINDNSQHDIIVRKSGTDLRLYVDGVLEKTITLSQNETMSTNNKPFTLLALNRATVSDWFASPLYNLRAWDVAIDLSEIANITSGSTPTSGLWGHWVLNSLSDLSGNGYDLEINGTVYQQKTPRDESDTTNDVLGNPLTNIGRRPNDAKLNDSNCLTADGTLYIAAAHLAGSETVVSSGGTSTPSISAGRIDFTAGTCWDLTLSDGTHYPLSEGGGIGIHDDSGAGSHGILTNATLASAWGGSQDDYHNNITSGFVHAYQPTVQIYSGAQASNIKNISFKFRSTDTNLIIFSDNTPSLYLIYCATGSASTAWSNGISGMTLEIDGSTTWGTTIGDLYNALCDGDVHQVIITNLSFQLSWATDGIYINKYTGNLQWDATTYLWDLVATDSGGNILPVQNPPSVRLPAVTSSLGPYSIPLTNPAGDYHNNAETTIDFNPDSTPEMGTTQLGITVPASHAFGDAWAASDQIFSRQRTLTEDRFVVMPEAQTGSALATIQRYTQP